MTSRKPKPDGADGHRGRMLDRFLLDKDHIMADHRLLELLLFNAIPRVDTREQAVTLIERFGSMKGVFEANTDELVEVDKIGEQTANFIKIVDAVMKRYYKRVNESRLEYRSEEAIQDLFEKRLAGRTEPTTSFAGFDAGYRLIAMVDLPDKLTTDISIPFPVVAEFISSYRPAYAAAARLVLPGVSYRGYCARAQIPMSLDATRSELEQNLFCLQVKYLGDFRVLGDGVVEEAKETEEE